MENACCRECGGGSITKQHYRTLDMLEDIIAEQGLHMALYFLHDIQTDNKQLSDLAGLAHETAKLRGSLKGRLKRVRNVL